MFISTKNFLVFWKYRRLFHIYGRNERLKTRFSGVNLCRPRVVDPKPSNNTWWCPKRTHSSVLFS